MSTHHDNCLREVSRHPGVLPGNVPAHRKAARQVYTFSSGSFEEQLQVWEAHVYVMKHIRAISPIAFTIAIEKVGGTDRLKKALRKR